MFGSQPLFGQTSSASSNPFAPNPFGSTTSCGSQSGGSAFGATSIGNGMLGGTSTGLFGGTSTGVFGGTAFGNSPSSSSSSLGGSSIFGAKPAFGGFGSTPTQAIPFGNTAQQSQPSFGSSLFGSNTTPFGATSQPAFGASTTPAFGQTSNPVFGAPTTSMFGATNTSPAFGATTTPAFGSTPTPAAFGSTSTAFGTSNAPAFGSGSAFGSSSTPLFGSSTTPSFNASTTAFGGASTPAFGASTTPAFGSSSSPAFGFGSTPSFGQSTPAFGSNPFGSTASPFGASTSPFGGQNTKFGSNVQGVSGGHRGGSRAAAYTPTVDNESGGAKFMSISFMPVYMDKSHEELRCDDYLAGDKGGPAPVTQSPTGISFGSQNTQAFAQQSANPFAQKTTAFSSSTFGNPSTGLSSPFSSSTPNPFGSTSSTTPSLFGQSSASGFSSSSPLFGVQGSSAFGSSPSIFNSASGSGSVPSFSSSLSFPNTQSASIFQSTTPSLGQTGSLFGQTTPTGTFGQTPTSTFGQAPTPAFGQTPTPAFGQTSTPAFGQTPTPTFGQTPTPAFGQTPTSAFGQNTTPFGQTNLFNTPPSSGFSSNLFSSTPSSFPSSNPSGFGQATPSPSTPFQSIHPAQTTNAFGFNFSGGQMQTPGTPGTPALNGVSNSPQQNMFSQLPAQTASPVTNPFGTLPAVPQISIMQTGSTPSVQYGISSLPGVEHHSPARMSPASPLLTSRYLSQRRSRLPTRKYYPKNDSPRVSFFSDDDDTPITPKADALLIPRENPKNLIINPVERSPVKAMPEKTSPLKDKSEIVHENGHVPEIMTTKDKEAVPTTPIQKPNGFINGHPRILDTNPLMPTIKHPDEYYTEPRIEEIYAKERVEPGFCSRVKDFVIGRHGYGSIRFSGETDVRGLDLESVVRFDNREVLVYPEETDKPAVGEGLNKAAEVTLLNVRCLDKKTKRAITEKGKIEQYKELLGRKAKEQGAEFLSYDAEKGEWKFKVSHFSKYGVVCGDEE